VRTAVAAAKSKPKTGLSGRGGVGNWTDTTIADGASDDKNKREALEAKIVQDVELGLMPPPRTYHQPERESAK
jgi:hypothetical protein